MELSDALYEDVIIPHDLLPKYSILHLIEQYGSNLQQKDEKLEKIIVRLRDTTERWVVISDYFRSPESQIEHWIYGSWKLLFSTRPPILSGPIGKWIHVC